MSIFEGADHSHQLRSVRLETLVRLRWLALAGQVITLAIVAFYYKFPLPLAESLVLVALSAAFNVALVVQFGASYRPPNFYAASQLAFDCLQLGGLLWLTGGLSNPFSLLLLAPVSVSATTLPQRETGAIGLLTVIIATGLALSHMPLPWYNGVAPLFPRLYILGMWIALVCGVSFMALYTMRVAHEARQLTDALTATELALSRQQQLTALDGLAAAAAHELGTPLSTITLAAKEMRRDAAQRNEDDQSILDDLDLIIDQTTRCRSILTRLRGLDDGGDTPFTSVPVSELLAELVRPFKLSDIEFVTATDKVNHGPEPVLRRTVSLLYGLQNFVENADQFARSEVVVRSYWTPEHVEITIRDDGPGFPLDLLTRLGEPYLTSRALNTDANAGPGGLGLGVFISKTLLERLGATVEFSNAEPTGHARVRIAWTRQALERFNLD